MTARLSAEEAAGDRGAVSAAGPHTFLFADLAGFSALTEAHGDADAAEVASAFCRDVRELLPDHGVQEVKAIGDALMLRGDDAARVVRLGLAIVEDVGGRPGVPTVRVGMHSGPAVSRDGDWFGASVNLAARVTAAAAGGQVLLTEATRRCAGDLADVVFAARGRHRFKNLRGDVALYAAMRPARRRRLPIDPVCRMAVDPRRAAGELRHAGRRHVFCSLECAAAFAADPSAFPPQHP